MGANTGKSNRQMQPASKGNNDDALATAVVNKIRNFEAKSYPVSQGYPPIGQAFDLYFDETSWEAERLSDQMKLMTEKFLQQTGGQKYLRTYANGVFTGIMKTDTGKDITECFFSVNGASDNNVNACTRELCESKTVQRFENIRLFSQFLACRKNGKLITDTNEFLSKVYQDPLIDEDHAKNVGATHENWVSDNAQTQRTEYPYKFSEQRRAEEFFLDTMLSRGGVTSQSTNSNPLAESKELVKDTELASAIIKKVRGFEARSYPSSKGYPTIGQAFDNYFKNPIWQATEPSKEILEMMAKRLRETGNEKFIPTITGGTFSGTAKAGQGEENVECFFCVWGAPDNNTNACMRELCEGAQEVRYSGMRLFSHFLGCTVNGKLVPDVSSLIDQIYHDVKVQNGKY
jgi:hypothetical protein